MGENQFSSTSSRPVGLGGPAGFPFRLRSSEQREEFPHTGHRSIVLLWLAAAWAGMALFACPLMAQEKTGDGSGSPGAATIAQLDPTLERKLFELESEVSAGDDMERELESDVSRRLEFSAEEIQRLRAATAELSSIAERLAAESGRIAAQGAGEPVVADIFRTQSRVRTVCLPSVELLDLRIADNCTTARQNLSEARTDSMIALQDR